MGVVAAVCYIRSVHRGHALVVGCLSLAGCWGRIDHDLLSDAAAPVDAADAPPVGPENALSVLSEADYQNLAATMCNDATYQLQNGCPSPCSFGLPTVPPGCMAINTGRSAVVYSAGDGSRRLIQQNQVDPCHYGWRLANDESTIEICDLTCQSLECDSSTQIKVMAGCFCGSRPY
jgi:hypothetical protein